MEINKETLIAMGVIEPKNPEFDADEVKKQIAIRDEAALKSLDMYRLEKGLAKK